MITVRLKPPEAIKVDDHDLDAVALELSDEGDLQDFRLELGRGWFIVWILPIEPGGRLRRILVDCAVAEVEMEVEEDPCEPTFSIGFRGSLATIGARVLEEVRLQLDGARYRCEARVREADGSLSVRTVERA